THLLFEIGAHFFKGLRSALLDSDEVIPERSLDWFAELANGQSECGLLELRNHLAVPESSQITALGARGRIIRLGLRQSVKVLSGQQLLTNFLRLGESFLIRQFLLTGLGRK